MDRTLYVIWRLMNLFFIFCNKYGLCKCPVNVTVIILDTKELKIKLYLYK